MEQRSLAASAVGKHSVQIGRAEDCDVVLRDRLFAAPTP